jgi:hypothetical protein
MINFILIQKSQTPELLFGYSLALNIAVRSWPLMTYAYNQSYWGGGDGRI